MVRLFRTRHLLIPALLVLALGGCAGGTTTAGSPGGVRRASNRVDAAELATVSELDVHSAITRLRPAWLRAGVQGALPGVIIDGSPQTDGPEALRAFRASDVLALEYMTASDATTRFGTGYVGGAILVTTKH
jgi:hypothetical protein